MELDRAKEILQSPDTIEVFFQGNPIWIEEIEEESKQVRIHTENDQHKMVSVEELSEQ